VSTKSDTAALLDTLAQRWNAHDLDFVYGLLDDDYREYLNDVLVKQSRAAARAADQFIYDSVPDYRRDIDALVGDDNCAAMRWRFCGTGPNGPFEIPVASFYRIADGKIVECWLYGDPVAYAHALGLDR
jgi:ketosteroid isomerase-like protein